MFTGLTVATVIGVPLGKVAMTAVPQRTALSHAFGALCVTLVGTSEFYLRAPNISPFLMAVLSMEVILGSLTFTGSLMAAGKLQEVLPQRPITYKGQEAVRTDIENLKAALNGLAPEEVFMPAIAPGFFSNQYYPTDKEFQYALAEALRVEYLLS